MSGKEEEPMRDIPICSICEKRPEFWILQPDMEEVEIDGWFWLHSNKIMKQDGCSRLVFVLPHGEGSFTLNEVRRITCRQEGLRGIVGKGIHIFTSDDPMFDEVLKQARRYKVVW